MHWTKHGCSLHPPLLLPPSPSPSPFPLRRWLRTSAMDRIIPHRRLSLLPPPPAAVWLGRWSFGLYGWGNLRSRRRLVDPGQNHPHDGSSRVLLGSTLQFYPLRRGMATESPLTLPDKHQTQMDVHPPQKMTQDRMNGFMDG